MTNTHINEPRALAYGLAAVLLWSTVATGFKLGLSVMSVTQLLWLGTGISWLVFLIYAAARRQLQPSSGLIKQSLVLGSINPAAYYLVLFAAYDRLPAHIAQPLNYTWAITLALFAIPILGQRLTRTMLAGIVISYLGVLLILSSAHGSESEGVSWIGVALALGSTLLWATYWLLNTRWQPPPAGLMFWSFSWGFVLLSMLLLATDTLPAFTTSNLLYGSWVGAVEMGITFILWQAALRSTAQVGRIGQLIFLSPFLSLLMISEVLGETISLTTIGGLATIVLGVAINQRATSPEQPA